MPVPTSKSSFQHLPGSPLRLVCLTFHVVFNCLSLLILSIVYLHIFLYFLISLTIFLILSFSHVL
jgi:hypothetical protein